MKISNIFFLISIFAFSLRMANASEAPVAIYPYYNDFPDIAAILNSKFSDRIDAADAIFVGEVSNIRTTYKNLTLANRCFVSFQALEWIKKPTENTKAFAEVLYYPYKNLLEANEKKDFLDAKNCPLMVGQTYLVFSSIDKTASPELQHLHINMQEGTTKLLTEALNDISAIKKHLASTGE